MVGTGGYAVCDYVAVPATPILISTLAIIAAVGGEYHGCLLVVALETAQGVRATSRPVEEGVDRSIDIARAAVKDDDLLKARAAATLPAVDDGL